MDVDAGTGAARKRAYSDVCALASDDDEAVSDERALEGMAAAFGNGGGRGGEEEMSSSEEEESESGSDSTGRTPPRRRGASWMPPQPRKTQPELEVPSLSDLLREKHAEDLIKQRRRDAAEREEAEFAAQLAETERLCGNIIATVASMDDALPRQFLRGAGSFADAAERGM